MPSPPDSPSTFPRLVGRAVERVEDAALLTGRGRFADDVGERPGTAHAAVLRSPHAHAEIVSLDAAVALSMPEVVTVLTGAEVAAWSRPFIAGVKQPMRHYALAVDRVRYTGEPVAVVVARDRYAAEDALERIEVEYRELDPVVDPVAAAAPGAPLLHRDVGSNVVSDRRLRYGDPDAAFANAAHRVAISVRYPRNACTPIEGFVVVADHLGDDGYDVLSNFQGPFTLHPVMARALGVPGARLRLRSPKDSGGSFGVKQAVFPYVVAMCKYRKNNRPIRVSERVCRAGRSTNEQRSVVSWAVSRPVSCDHLPYRPLNRRSHAKRPGLPEHLSPSRRTRGGTRGGRGTAHRARALRRRRGGAARHRPRRGAALAACTCRDRLPRRGRGAFVPKSDPQVKRLLATREDIFPHYTQEYFEREFSIPFSIRRTEPIDGSERTLYLMERRNG